MLFWVLVWLSMSNSLTSAFINTTCNPVAKIWTAQDPADPHSYFICTQEGFYERQSCPLVNGARKVFVPVVQECLLLFNDDHTKRRHRLPPSVLGPQTVGAACRTNLDCLSGALCSNSVCACLVNHVEIGGYCWRKINPEESGCTYNQQCSVVWPDARCVNSVCKCPFNKQAAYTKDGAVCYGPGECPTNGPNPKLIREDSNDYVSCSTTGGCGQWSDIYDCIDSSETRDGYCCPSRAYACIQPLDSGMVASSVQPSQRFYYHSISQSCQSFTYSGAGGNANNFLTAEQCESYCKQTCPRGQPQYSGSNRITAASTSAQSCNFDLFGGTSRSSCGLNHQCSRIGSSQMCCPEKSFICNPNGGVVGIGTSAPYNRGFAAFNGNPPPSTRFYWDSERRQCMPFRYLGQGGNFNNFQSQADCEAFCGRSPCKYGDPLIDPSARSANASCLDGGWCPANHDCTNGVCCPNAARDGEVECQYGTALKDGRGRPYQCAITGGGRNIGRSCPANNDCYFDGVTYGCCPTQPFACGQPLDSGRQCSSNGSLRWYFDPLTHACRSFSYLGCDGNSNNFLLERDCRMYCAASGCPDGGEPYTEINGQWRICSTSSECPATHTCIPASAVSGLSQTNRCCPKKVAICSLPRDVGGECGAKMTRYAFNAQSRSCEPFVFNGCNGNANNFPTAQSCSVFCNSAACSFGETAYLEPSTNRALSCGNGSGCPNGYSCTWDPLQGRSVCCGGRADAGDVGGGICPAGHKPYTDPSGDVRQCSPDGQNPCPIHHQCFYNSARNQYYCCESRPPPLCPNTGRAFTDQNGQPRPCALNVAYACPSGFTCQATTSRALFGYCCSASSFLPPVGCPPGFEVALRNRLAQTCIVGSLDSCQSDSVCHAPPSESVGVCCTSVTRTPTTVAEIAQQDCPSGARPSSANGVVRTCWGALDCPAGYECADRKCCPAAALACSSPFDAGTPCQSNGPTIRYFYNETSSSCTTFAYSGCNGNGNNFKSLSSCQAFCATRSNDKICPNGEEPLKANGAIQACTSSVSGCPRSYYCTLGERNTSTGFCCPLSAEAMPTCPGLDRPYVDPNSGQPQPCTYGDPRSSWCPNGYICAKSKRGGGSFCCAENDDRQQQQTSDPCPRGQGPLNIRGTRTPQTCRFFGPPPACPGGSRCTYSSVHMQYICCQDAPIAESTDECHKLFPYPGTSLPLRCARDPSSTEGICPTGGRCAYSSQHGYEVCCLVTSSSGNKLEQGIESIGSLAKSTETDSRGFFEPAPRKTITEISCSLGTTISSDGLTCLPELNLGEFGCIDDVQCSSNGRCDHSVHQCICDQNMVVYENFCVFDCPITHVNMNGFCEPLPLHLG